MASVISICNAALRKVGASTITSLNQGTKNSNFCNDRYAELRDALLEMHPWNFAVKTAKLSQTVTTPAVRFDYQYNFPDDYIRAITVHENDQGTGIGDYKIRGNKVESSSNQLWMVYVSLETDPNKMTPLFRDTLAFMMAMEAATSIAEDRGLYEIMEDAFKRSLRRARSADSQADLPDRMPVGSWRTSRSGRLAERRWGF